jgi:septation ring formation regulator EzrA
MNDKELLQAQVDELVKGQMKAQGEYRRLEETTAGLRQELQNIDSALIEMKRILQMNNNLKDSPQYPQYTGLFRLVELVEAAQKRKDWTK